MLRSITRDMWRVHDVMRVDSLSNYNWVHAEGDRIFIEPLLEPERAEPPPNKNPLKKSK